MEADYVEPAVVADRFERLRAVVERSALVRHEARIGRIEEVLVEGPSRRDPTCSPAGAARASSCTSSRQRASASRRARSHASRSPGCAAPPECGLLEVTAAPRHRTRIP